jgi:hypothetical protein
MTDHDVDMTLPVPHVTNRHARPQDVSGSANALRGAPIHDRTHKAGHGIRWNSAEGGSS